jgi:Winged helix DNA-binding domain
MNIRQARLYNQHLCNNSLVSTEAVVRHFGAVQAQDYAASVWSIGLRLPNATLQVVEQSIYDRRIVRSWTMRGTIHFAPAEDVGWMVENFAKPRNASFLNGYLKKIDLTLPILEQSRKVLERELVGQCLTRPEIYAQLEQAGIKKVRDWGLHIIGYWAQEGLLCIAPHRGKQVTIALLDDWIPRQRKLSAEEAHSELAKRYFSSHSPATPQDFAWWSGLPMGKARTALESVSGLVTVELEGREYWMTPETVSYTEQTFSAHLLSPFDEYTVAYKDRSSALTQEQLRDARYGIFGPSLLLNGLIVGAWKRSFKGKTLRLAMQPTRALEETERNALMLEAERYAQFFGCKLEMVL